MLQSLLDVFFPDNCVFCHQNPIQNRLGLCQVCALKIPRSLRMFPQDQSLAHWVALGDYAGPLGAVVRTAKYRPDVSKMKELARCFAASFDHLDIDVVVPVASSPKRLYQRGFNPALLLAQGLSRKFKKPCLNVLRRLDSTSQASKNRQQRCGSSIRFDTRRNLDNCVVLLVDDVRTTGDTLRSCAQCLHAAGAHTVLGATLAYAA